MGHTELVFNRASHVMRVIPEALASVFHTQTLTVSQCKMYFLLQIIVKDVACIPQNFL